MRYRLKRALKRVFTVFIVPHDESEPRSFKAPLWIFQVTGILIFIFVTSYLILYYNAGNLRDRTEELQDNLTEERLQQEDLLEELEQQEEEFLEEKQVQEEKIEEIIQETHEIISEMEKIRELRESVYDEVDGLDPPENMSSISESSSLSEESFSSLSRGRSPEINIERAEGNLELIQASLEEKKVSLESLLGELDEHNRRLRATPSIRPTHGTITSGFGHREDPVTGGGSFHSGVDISNSHGTPVYATAYGRVSSTSYRGGYGNMIVIDHGYGYQTCYAHLSSFAVSENQQVSRGQVIGYMGRTGRTTGTHLHYEVRKNGNAVNPANYF